MLSRLPVEIFCLIINFLQNSSRDLKALSLVSKWLRSSTEAALFASLVVRFVPEHPRRLRLQCEGDGTLSRNQRFIHNIGGITFDFAFGFFPRPSCLPHICLDRHEDTEEDDVNYCGFKQLTDQTLSYLQLLRPQKLHTFRWRLRTCIPESILGPQGLLPTTQSNITCLSLVTNPKGYLSTIQGQSLIDLSRFEKVTDFSWRGIGTVQDVDALQPLISNNRKHLKRLHLDIEECSKLIRDWHEAHNRGPMFYDCFVSGILGLERSGPDSLFPCLEQLSLRGVNLRGFPTLQFREFGFGSLRTLKVSNSSSVEWLLNAYFVESPKPKLTACEIVFTDREGRQGSLRSALLFREFLEKCSDLEDVFIMARYPYQTTKTCRDLFLSYGSSFRRLVLHDMTSSRPMSERETQTRKSTHDPLYKKLQSGESNLQCLGLSDSCTRFLYKLIDAKVRPSLKLLHMRGFGGKNIKKSDSYINSDSLLEDELYLKSKMELLRYAITLDALVLAGEDLEAFREQNMSSVPPPLPLNVNIWQGMDPTLFTLAQWAFSPEGLPDLQVLAYGDFSHNGLYKDYTVLLCRNEKYNCNPNVEWTFRGLRSDDWASQQLVNENMDFLSACAVDDAILN